VLIAVKLLVTGACFWYLWRQIDVSQVVSTVPLLDYRWVAFAALVIMLEIPLLALRWGNVVTALAARNERMTQAVMIDITSIGQFFAQVLPSVAGDGVRVWPLARLGSTWSTAVTSVVIDRAIGVDVLIALGFAILLLPSGLAARRISPRRALGVWWATFRWQRRPVACTEARVAICPLAIFSLVGGIGHERAPARRKGSGGVSHGVPPPPARSLSLPCGRWGARKACFCRSRRGGAIHGHDQRGVGTDLGRRPGIAGARSNLGSRQSRRRAGTGIAVFRGIRAGPHGRARCPERRSGWSIRSRIHGVPPRGGE
jgi:hypothetical protein